MKRSKVFFLLAFIAAIPALLIWANFTQYAFVGHGFLPVGEGDMNFARSMVAWVSASVAGFLLSVGIGATP